MYRRLRCFSASPCIACMAALWVTSTLQAQLAIELEASVSEVAGRFQYDYTLRNLDTSSAGINGFLMSVASGAQIADMTGPENWARFYDEEERNLQIAWLSEGSEFDIQPAMEATFSLSSSYAPGEQNYLVAAFTADFSDVLGSVAGMIEAPTVPPETTVDCNGDGLVNADDLACACANQIRDALLAELSLIEGDLNGDGEVAFADFLVLAANFGQSAQSYTEGDIDCNGMVAFADFLVLSSNFGRDSGGEVAPVPEPASPLLAGLAVWGFAARRHRKCLA